VSLRNQWMIALVMFLVLILLPACSLISAAEVTPMSSQTPAFVQTESNLEVRAASPSERSDSLDNCPAPTAEALDLINEEQRYCLLYPTGYEVVQPNPNETVLVVGSLMNQSDPRASIEVLHVSDDYTAVQAADQTVSEFPGFPIVRNDLAIAGQEGIVLDSIPGQDMNRRVVVVHQGLLYTLTFSPASADAGEVYQRMEQLYTTVVESFTFLP
jgi:hypothetical protein